MSLKDHNSVILEWMVASGNEEMALRFWREIGEPKEVNGQEVAAQVEIKHAIQTNNYAEALHLLSHISEGSADEAKAQGVFRLQFARLVMMLENKEDPEQVIQHAKLAVVPSIAKLQKEEGEKYTKLLNSFMALLVLPDLARPEETKELGDEQRLQTWVLDKIRVYFENKKGEPRLSKMVNCYRAIEKFAI